MKIYFVTGNKDKLKEAQAMWSEVEGINIDLDEIQELDGKKIIEAKLKEAIKQKPGIPLIVEDQSVMIDGMNGLPGPLIKWFVKSMGLEGLVKMAESVGNNNCEARTIIGYTDKLGNTNYFEATIKGKIVSPRGNIGWGWDSVFQPEGYNETFSEMTIEQKNELSMRRMALEKLKKYLDRK